MTEPKGPDDGVGSAILQVAEDAKAYAAARIELYKATAAARFGTVKTGLILGAVAGALALAALIVLLVGLVLTLAPLIGPLGATLVVVAVVLVIAGLFGRMAATALSAAMGPIE